MTAPLLRRTVLVTTAATLPLVAAGPAVAEVPEGWSDPAEVSFLELMLVVAGIPLLLGLAIVLAVYVPAMARGERVSPGTETPDQWFGGPRRDAGELESASDSTTTGGASGRW